MEADGGVESSVPKLCVLEYLGWPAHSEKAAMIRQVLEMFQFIFASRAALYRSVYCEMGKLFLPIISPVFSIKKSFPGSVIIWDGGLWTTFKKLCMSIIQTP